MSSSLDSIPPGWEEAITNSPETLPPGFENPSSLSTHTSPPQDNPSSSLPSPALPPPQENQVNLTYCPPSPSPTPPQEIQSHQHPPSHKSPQDKGGPLPHPLCSPPHETPDSLPPFPSLLQENLDALPRSPLQPQDGQGSLPSSQLLQGNLGSLNPPIPQSLPGFRLERTGEEDEGFEPPTRYKMGQMVCGSCNELLSYPRGSKYVQCACCQTTNFVLEAHQVGIVKCGKCSVLLMYPYASKSLRCSSCHYVTEIGPHNIRPPVSVLQGFPAPP